VVQKSIPKNVVQKKLRRISHKDTKALRKNSPEGKKTSYRLPGKKLFVHLCGLVSLWPKKSTPKKCSAKKIAENLATKGTKKNSREEKKTSYRLPGKKLFVHLCVLAPFGSKKTLFVPSCLCGPKKVPQKIPDYEPTLPPPPYIFAAWKIITPHI
jgi:hypothetical protein